MGNDHISGAGLAPFDEDLPAQDLSTLTPPLPMERVGANPWLVPQQPPRSLLGDVLADHANYYSRRNLSLLAVGVGVAAIMANTRFDETIQGNY